MPVWARVLWHPNNVDWESGEGDPDFSFSGKPRNPVASRSGVGKDARMITAPTAYSTRPLTPDPPGTALARYFIALSKGADAIDFAESNPGFRSTPHIARAIKAAIAPATTTDPTWASPLVSYGLVEELFGLLRAVSVTAQLANAFRRVPLASLVAIEEGAGFSATWVGEGAEIPVSATAFNQTPLAPAKIRAMAVVSQELLRVGDPLAERAVARAITNAVARYADAQLLDPSVTAIAATRPAAITHGATAIASTGSSATQIATDLAALVAAVTTPGPFVWTMRPQTFMTIGLKIPGIATATTLLGADVVLAPHGPQQVTLLDPAEILYAEDPDATELSIGRQASIRMDDGGSPPAATIVSLFHANLVALRAGISVSWARTRDGAVAYMPVSY